MFELGKVLNKTVVAIVAYQSDRRVKIGLIPRYILFDDNTTVVEFTEQDYYSYHDCSCSARNIIVHSDKRLWQIIHDNVDGVYPDANYDL